MSAEGTGTHGSSFRDETGGFGIREIDGGIYERIRGRSYKAECTLPLRDLRYLRLLHRDLSGRTLKGEMICNRRIAEDVLEIFEKLYEAGYPIEHVRLVDDYGADDEASMEDNNSSSFNFREIVRTGEVSKHGLGLAVDINPLYNPYWKIVDGDEIILPSAGRPYLDRGASFPYKIERGDLCVRLFTKKGFFWGGDWTNRKDYQHFEIPPEQIRKWYRY